MEIAEFQSLLSADGQTILDELLKESPTDKNFLQLFQKYSKNYPPSLVQSALTISISRTQAIKKFPFNRKLFATREALQQASSWHISQHRAKRFRGFEQIMDLGCSIGSDSIALGEISPTTGIDINPLRIAMAKENSKILNTQTNFIEMDINNFDASKYKNSSTAIFFDPARRANQNRIYNVENYSPPLSIIKNWLPLIPNIGVKISPGVKISQLEDYDCEIEFISLDGELKEAVLWFGSLKKHHRQATLLPSGIIMNQLPPTSLLVTEPKKFIYEPDPAIIRAGLVTSVGEQISGSKIHEKIAYLTNDSGINTPFARKWKIESWMPFNLKNLRKHLREINVGNLIVKKRGSPIEPTYLIKKMKLSGTEARTIFLTKFNNKPIVIISFPQK
jgi:hypothetical protein